MRVDGTVRPPGDKSITHRALMLAAATRGSSVVYHPLVSADTRSTAACLRALGAGVGRMRRGGAVAVHGVPWSRPDRTLHCGNAGTTARLLLGLLAGHPFDARLTGDRSLRRRPMRRVTDPLVQMGATVRLERGDGLPLRITGGPLAPLEWRLPVATAQVKSALLFAGLAAGAGVVVHEPARSRDHTERMFRALGLPVRSEGATAVLEPVSAGLAALRPSEWTIPGDASSSAFLVAAGLLADRGELCVTGVGLNPTRTGFLRVLERMGAAVLRETVTEVGGEPVGDLVVRPSSLRGTEVPADEVASLIDEVPVLAVLASRAAGETVFREVGELRVKESDRLGLVAANLRAVGAEAEVSGHDLIVRGGTAPPRGRVETGHDHRLAMAFALLGMLDGADVELSERGSPGISYPGFFDDLARITGRG